MLGWNEAMFGKIYSILGINSMIGGFIAGTLLKIFGAYNLTFVSSAMVSLAFLTYGFTRTPWHFYTSLFLGSPGTLCSIAPNALIVKMGGEKNINFGELTAARNNLNAISRVISPLIFSRLYTLGHKFNIPGLPFFVVAGFVAAANALMFTTRNSPLWIKGSRQTSKDALEQSQDDSKNALENSQGDFPSSSSTDSK